MRFITVTLDPSLEHTLVTHYFAPGYQNRTQQVKNLDPVGRGMNIARALDRLACNVETIIPLGNDATGRAYTSLAMAENFKTTFITVDAQTRTRTLILDTGHNNETQIIEPETAHSETNFQKLMHLLQNTITPNEVVVFSGSLPGNAPDDLYARLVALAHAQGAQVVMAHGGPALEKALPHQPELLALRQIECEAFFNRPIRILDDLLAAGRDLLQRGAGQALIEGWVTGKALLFTPAGEWELELDELWGGTTSGMWDALLAGYLSARAENCTFAQALQRGGAAASYTANQVGNQFPTPAELTPILPHIHPKRLEATLSPWPTTALIAEG